MNREVSSGEKTGSSLLLLRLEATNLAQREEKREAEGAVELGRESKRQTDR